MRLLVCSDLHCEFHKDHGRSLIKSLSKDVDGIVIAGDISAGSYLAFAIHMLCDLYPQVICVLGNHEYYGTSPRSLHVKMKSIKRSNFHLLINETKVIEGVKFVGSTLWFSYDHSNFRWENNLNDFKCIKDFKPWVYEQNKESLSFLQNNLDKDSVLITHHIPSWQGLDPRFAGDPCNKFFICGEAEPIILEKQPKYVIHGHTHTSFRYEIGDSKVICNPHGYPRENNRFENDLIIEV